MIPRLHAVAGVPFRLEGTAYDFGRAICSVQFSLDGGENWTAYPTAGADEVRNLSWSFEMTLEEAGSYELLVRSVNDRGEESPEPAHVFVDVEAVLT